MSRRRLERGYWNGRHVRPTEKETRRLYRYNTERGAYMHRFSVRIISDWPYPDELITEMRLPRKTKKALWKQFNGLPETDPRSGVLAYNGWTWGIWWSTPGLFHKGRKP